METNSSIPRSSYTGEPTMPSPASGALPYTTAAAFRTALKARFTAIAKQDSRYTTNELQRQFAYDRILSRCFSTRGCPAVGAQGSRGAAGPAA